MNIFKNNTDFVPKSNIAHLNKLFLDFLLLAREIRERLGDQSPLLDEYLTLLFDGANEITSFEAAEEGFSSMFEMHYMCKDKTVRYHLVMDEFFGHAKEYIDEHPVDEGSSFPKEALYCALLSGDYLSKEAEKFEKRLEENLSSVLDMPKLESLYEKISRIVGGKRKMDKLNLLFKERFLTATATDLFLQGATDHLLYCLTSHDTKTDKQVFQKLLELDWYEESAK